jgi:hypothetical protein
VAALIDQQTGGQAALARPQGHPEAAVKRLSHLLHNDRLTPQDFAAWLCRQALRPVPRTGRVRLPIDWSRKQHQHLLGVSLVVGRRALPICWRAYDQTVLKGRMQRYALAGLRRAFALRCQYVAPHRVRLAADRGCTDAALCTCCAPLGLRAILRVKGRVMVALDGQWRKRHRVRFVGNSRRHNLGQVAYGESSPHRVGLTMSRARDKKDHWGLGYLVSSQPLRAQPMATAYGDRVCCEEGCRDTKWSLGFAQARVTAMHAWSRLFALFAIALLARTSLGMRLLLGGGPPARRWLRRVASRRRDRCELSLIAAVIALIHQDRSLMRALSTRTKLNLEANVANVS